MSSLEEKLSTLLTSPAEIEHSSFHSSVCLIYLDSRILLIRRSELVPSHKGDLALVGGKVEAGENFLQAALREFEEETSLPSHCLEFQGILPSTLTAQNWTVAVCVFKLRWDEAEFLKKVKSNGEWVEAFFVSDELLLQKKNWSYINVIRRNDKKKIMFCNILHEKKNLWGMTATILYSIFQKYLK